MLLRSIKNNIKKILPRSIYEIFISIKYFKQPKIANYKYYVSHVEGKDGIEIGGPSMLFKTNLPIYQAIKNLDGVNFTGSTVWEGNIKAGHTYKYIRNKRGRQFISDGTVLSQNKNNSYDFVLSSNCLEHIANPLKALLEWRRILRDQGVLILVLPNKKNNFDHKRSTTSFSHLIEDLNKNTTEHDLTHLDEILSFHDLSMDAPAGDIDNFKDRSLNNFTNRTLHHHVFDINLMRDMFDFLQMKVVQESVTDNDLLMMAVKVT